MEAMRPAAPLKQAPLRRWPGRRPGKAAEGIPLLAVILVAVCAYLLLLDRLGVSPAATTDFPFVD